jgi:hypothetical protein
MGAILVTEREVEKVRGEAEDGTRDRIPIVSDLATSAELSIHDRAWYNKFGGGAESLRQPHSPTLYKPYLGF